LKGSYYDGYFEQVAERISAVLTPEIRETILKLKYETPDTEEIMGIEYYQAVIQDGIHDYLFCMLQARRIGNFLIKYNFMNPLIKKKPFNKPDRPLYINTAPQVI